MPTASTYNRNRIIGAFIILALIIVSFFVFMRVNEQRVIDTNTVYAESTTNQSAERVNDLMVSAQNAIGTAARIYQSTVLEEKITPQSLSLVSENGIFNYIAYCNADGETITPTGRTLDTHTQDFYINGMEGQSGVAVYTTNEGSDADVIMVYAPVTDNDGKPMGVLLGAFDEERMEEMLTESFMGEKLSVYLCQADGNIIAASTRNNRGYTNARQIYSDNPDNLNFLETIDAAFNNLNDISFTYHGSAGTGIAYITKLQNYDWMLLCMFPSAITSGLVNSANTAGLFLLVAITLAFIAFIIMLLFQGRREGEKLRLEKLELSRMVDAVTNLYRRFVYIDLENDTYEYVKNDIPEAGLAIRGRYEDYYNYWTNYILKGPELDDMKNFLSKSGLRKELSNGKPFAQHEYMIEMNGEIRWMQGSALVIKREVDEVETLLLAVQDITEMKQREEQSRIALEEAYNAAEQASKAKSDFLNSMSHDIRTPMNSIMGLTALATMYIDDKDRVKDCLEKITISSRHLLSLINEVLDMAKIESGNIALSEEDFDIPEMIDSLLTIINPQVEAKHQTLKVDIANIRHEHVTGDPLRLQQVFVNIMGNSVKFTPEGGSVGLTIRELPSKIPGSGHYEFKFSDTGVGMSEEFVQRVFEPFARANDSRVTKVEGTGLGMSIVKSVVSLMNGNIDVKSKLGEGSVFTVDVYLKLRDVEHADISELAGLHVLVADDDQMACESACALLNEMGMNSDWVLTGGEAIQRVKESMETGNEYVAVILDWKMPGMSGIETAAEIRKISDDLPIIILSAYDWSAIEQEARATGVDAFISKPLFRSRLSHVMRDLILDNPVVESNTLDNLRKQNFAGYRILLVEDNALAASIAEDILDITGVEVEHAENGKVAVEMATEKPAGYYDLILMDIQMPIMNGYEASRAIRDSGREDLKTIPIIALTADAFSDDVLKAKNAGMNGHMSKPMEIDILVDTLNTWLHDKK